MIISDSGILGTSKLDLPSYIYKRENRFICKLQVTSLGYLGVNTVVVRYDGSSEDVYRAKVLFTGDWVELEFPTPAAGQHSMWVGIGSDNGFFFSGFDVATLDIFAGFDPRGAFSRLLANTCTGFILPQKVGYGYGIKLMCNEVDSATNATYADGVLTLDDATPTFSVSKTSLLGTQTEEYHTTEIEDDVVCEFDTNYGDESYGTIKACVAFELIQDKRTTAFDEIDRKGVCGDAIEKQHDEVLTVGYRNISNFDALYYSLLVERSTDWKINLNGIYYLASVSKVSFTENYGYIGTKNFEIDLKLRHYADIY